MAPTDCVHRALRRCTTPLCLYVYRNTSGPFLAIVRQCALRTLADNLSPLRLLPSYYLDLQFLHSTTSREVVLCYLPPNPGCSFSSAQMIEFRGNVILGIKILGPVLKVDQIPPICIIRVPAVALLLQVTGRGVDRQRQYPTPRRVSASAGGLPRAGVHRDMGQQHQQLCRQATLVSLVLCDVSSPNQSQRDTSPCRPLTMDQQSDLHV